MPKQNPYKNPNIGESPSISSHSDVSSEADTSQTSSGGFSGYNLDREYREWMRRGRIPRIIIALGCVGWLIFFVLIVVLGFIEPFFDYRWEEIAWGIGYIVVTLKLHLSERRKMKYRYSLKRFLAYGFINLLVPVIFMVVFMIAIRLISELILGVLLYNINYKGFNEKLNKRGLCEKRQKQINEAKRIGKETKVIPENALLV